MEFQILQHRLYLVNFEELFKNNIEAKIVDDLEKYKLLGGILTKEKKSFFYHHIIYEICKFILFKKTNNKIVIYFTHSYENLELFKYFKEKEVIKIIQKVVVSIRKYLPIRVFESSYPFHYFIHLYGKEDGRAIEIINSIKGECNEFGHKKHNFSQIKQFSITHNLYFLNNQFFNDIKSGQLLYC